MLVHAGACMTEIEYQTRAESIAYARPRLGRRSLRCEPSATRRTLSPPVTKAQRALLSCLPECMLYAAATSGFNPAKDADPPPRCSACSRPGRARCIARPTTLDRHAALLADSQCFFLALSLPRSCLDATIVTLTSDNPCDSPVSSPRQTQGYGVRVPTELFLAGDAGIRIVNPVSRSPRRHVKVERASIQPRQAKAAYD